MIANHFKSKGCARRHRRRRRRRTTARLLQRHADAQANRLLTWINSTVLPAAGDPDVLLLGDFNSYAQEDPVDDASRPAGTPISRRRSTARTPTPTSSTASSATSTTPSPARACSPQVTGADAWHINADEVPLFDYNDEIGDSPGEATSKRSRTAPPSCRRASCSSRPRRTGPSDHDPVLVGCSPVADLAITKTDGVTTAVPGGSVTYTITGVERGSGSGDRRHRRRHLPGRSSPAPGPAWAPAAAPARRRARATSTTPSTCRPAAASPTPRAARSGVGDRNARATPRPSRAARRRRSRTRRNNSATDTDTLTPQADLAITKTDGVTTADARRLGDLHDHGLQRRSEQRRRARRWPTPSRPSSPAPGPASAPAAAPARRPARATSTTRVNLPAGGSVTYTASCTISAAATGTLSQHGDGRGSGRRHRSDSGQQLGDRHRRRVARLGRPVGRPRSTRPIR